VNALVMMASTNGARSGAMHGLELLPSEECS